MKHERADVLCRLLTERPDDGDIDDDLQVTAVATWKQPELSENSDATADGRLLETKEQTLVTIDEFLHAQRRDSY